MDAAETTGQERVKLEVAESLILRRVGAGGDETGQASGRVNRLDPLQERQTAAEQGQLQATKNEVTPPPAGERDTGEGTQAEPQQHTADRMGNQVETTHAFRRGGPVWVCCALLLAISIVLVVVALACVFMSLWALQGGRNDEELIDGGLVTTALLALVAAVLTGYSFARKLALPVRSVDQICHTLSDLHSAVVRGSVSKPLLVFARAQYSRLRFEPRERAETDSVAHLSALHGAANVLEAYTTSGAARAPNKESGEDLPRVQDAPDEARPLSKTENSILDELERRFINSLDLQSTGADVEPSAKAQQVLDDIEHRLSEALQHRDAAERWQKEAHQSTEMSLQLKKEKLTLQERMREILMENRYLSGKLLRLSRFETVTPIENEQRQELQVNLGRARQTIQSLNGELKNAKVLLTGERHTSESFKELLWNSRAELLASAGRYDLLNKQFGLIVRQVSEIQVRQYRELRRPFRWIRIKPAPNQDLVPRLTPYKVARNANETLVFQWPKTEPAPDGAVRTMVTYEVDVLFHAWDKQAELDIRVLQLSYLPFSRYSLDFVLCLTGQSGSGKSYIAWSADELGILSTVARALFRFNEELPKLDQLRIQYEAFEYTRDNVERDLLQGYLAKHNVNDDNGWTLESPDEFDAHIEECVFSKSTGQRAVRPTQQNTHSDRGHAIFRFKLSNSMQAINYSLTIIDLCGREEQPKEEMYEGHLADWEWINKSRAAARTAIIDGRTGDWDVSKFTSMLNHVITPTTVKVFIACLSSDSEEEAQAHYTLSDL